MSFRTWLIHFSNLDLYQIQCTLPGMINNKMKIAMPATPPLRNYFPSRTLFTIDVLLGLVFALDHLEIEVTENLETRSLRKTLLTNLNHCIVYP